jgi:hypothetical protein
MVRPLRSGGGIFVVWAVQCGRCSRSADLATDDLPLSRYGMREAMQDAALRGFSRDRLYGYLCLSCRLSLRKKIGG